MNPQRLDCGGPEVKSRHARGDERRPTDLPIRRRIQGGRCIREAARDGATPNQLTTTPRTPLSLTASETVCRAREVGASFHNVRIDHRCAKISVAQKLLNNADVRAALERIE